MDVRPWGAAGTKVAATAVRSWPAKILTAVAATLVPLRATRSESVSAIRPPPPSAHQHSLQKSFAPESCKKRRIKLCGQEKN